MKKLTGPRPGPERVRDHSYGTIKEILQFKCKTLKYHLKMKMYNFLWVHDILINQIQLPLGLMTSACRSPSGVKISRSVHCIRQIYHSSKKGILPSPEKSFSQKTWHLLWRDMRRTFKTFISIIFGTNAIRIVLSTACVRKHRRRFGFIWQAVRLVSINSFISVYLVYKCTFWIFLGRVGFCWPAMDWPLPLKLIFMYF